jgi:hypothetical protein
MPIRHPFDAEVSYNTEEASLWYKEHGLIISPDTLASKHSTGAEGPRWFKIGKIVYYKASALRSYLLFKLTPEVQSTSEMKVTQQLRIDDKSEAAPIDGESDHAKAPNTYQKRDVCIIRAYN